MGFFTYPNATVIIRTLVFFILSVTFLLLMFGPLLHENLPSVMNMIAPPLDSSFFPFSVSIPFINPSPRQVPPSALKRLIAFTNVSLVVSFTAVNETSAEAVSLYKKNIE